MCALGEVDDGDVRTPTSRRPAALPANLVLPDLLAVEYIKRNAQNMRCLLVLGNDPARITSSKAWTIT